MLEVFTFRPILEAKEVFRLLLLLYCCCIVIFSPRACAVLIRYYKHVFFSVGYHVPSGNMYSWVTSQRRGPGALTITQQPVHSQ